MIQEKQLIAKIAQRYSLELLLLFGSQATGQAHGRSDFDVAYLSSKSLDLENEAKLILELSSIFRSENIDLVNLKKASPLLFYAIFKDSQVIYEKDSLIFPTLRAYSFKKYIEAKPLYEAKFKQLEAVMKSN